MIPLMHPVPLCVVIGECLVFLIYRGGCFSCVLMCHSVFVSVCQEAGDACDRQVVIEALLEKDNKRITFYIFLSEATYEDTSCCTSWQRRSEG